MKTQLKIPKIGKMRCFALDQEIWCKSTVIKIKVRIREKEEWSLKTIMSGLLHKSIIDNFTYGVWSVKRKTYLCSLYDSKRMKVQLVLKMNSHLQGIVFLIKFSHLEEFFRISACFESSLSFLWCILSCYLRSWISCFIFS